MKVLNIWFWFISNNNNVPFMCLSEGVSMFLCVGMTGLGSPAWEIPRWKFSVMTSLSIHTKAIGPRRLGYHWSHLQRSHFVEHVRIVTLYKHFVTSY
jgi:hypothetical protein